MPELPTTLIRLAEELRLHRHFLLELRRTANSPGFPRLPSKAQACHQAFIRAHEDAAQRLFVEGGFPEPSLVEALAARLERELVPPPQHPTARHLACLRRVLARRLSIGLEPGVGSAPAFLQSI